MDYSAGMFIGSLGGVLAFLGALIWITDTVRDRNAAKELDAEVRRKEASRPIIIAL